MLRDQLFPRGKDGRRRLGEVHRRDPADPGHCQKAQRHLVRMPVPPLARLAARGDWARSAASST